jgi:hypothetical protein
MQNWFPTLNAALEAEDLVHHWPVGKNIGYGETVSFASRGRWITVYRETNGRYERPISYQTQMEDTYPMDPDQRVAGRAIQI